MIEAMIIAAAAVVVPARAAPVPARAAPAPARVAPAPVVRPEPITPLHPIYAPVIIPSHCEKDCKK